MNNSRYLSPPPGESKMSVLLYGKLKTSRKKCYELETEMDVSATTLRKMMKHPETADFGELKRLAKKLGVSKTEFIKAMEW